MIPTLRASIRLDELAARPFQLASHPCDDRRVSDVLLVSTLGLRVPGVM